MEGPCADSEEKREPAGDIDTEVVDSLKVLDPERPIREADVSRQARSATSVAIDPERKSAALDFCRVKLTV